MTLSDITTRATAIGGPSTIDDLPIAVLGFEDRDLVTVNRRWVALTGLELDVSRGTGWLNAVHSDDWATARQFPPTASPADTIAEWRLLSVDGRDTVWVQATSGPLDLGPKGRFVVALTEIDAHKANEAGLLHRASHDSLTGLLNHGAFMTRVGDAVHEAAAADAGMCAVLYLDLDHFKDINDEFGHHVGDRLLAAVSHRIRASLRPSDTLARIGGDEIGVLCPVLDSEGDALQLAGRIVDTIAQPFTIGERVVHTSVSIGIAFSGGDGRAALDLVEQADQAMYRAKIRGRGQWATTGSTYAEDPRAAVDVKNVLGGVIQVQKQLDELLSWIDLGDAGWDRLSQASHALRRANSLLRGDVRIG